MSSALIMTSVRRGQAPQGGKLVRRVALDFGCVLLTAALALAAGLTINRLSSKPLPLRYQSPEERFDRELTSLVAAPPMAIAPAPPIELAQFRSAVDGKSALIFDARPAAFFVRGHVPGALNLARDDFAHDYRRLSGVVKAAGDKPIIVYCSGGECHDSRLVANALLTLGYSNVSVFTGGWEAWSAAGLPVATGAAP
jgi:rhodanese-related sulfurtransferase